MKSHLILSLDYEIFGDGSGCLQHCLINPAQECLSITDKYGARQSFFVDALEFACFRAAANQNGADVKLKQEYQALETQLIDMCKGNHNVQLHLHPQWLSAQGKPGLWKLDYSKWRIGDLNEQDIKDSICQGLAYLQDLGFSQVNVFRAGGWAIQPSEHVVEHLLANQVIMDSTVAPGLFSLAKGDWFNFSKAPKKPFWYVSEDVCQENPRGQLLEVPILTQFIGRRSHVKALKEQRRQASFPAGCHGTYGNPNNKWQSLKHKFSRIANIGTSMLDFSTMPGWALIETTEKYMENFKDFDGPLPLVAIGHNKNFTAWSADNLAEFLAWAEKNPEIEMSDYQSWHNSLLGRDA